MSPYDRVIAALETIGSLHRGENWQCPAHHDKTPSMTVKRSVHLETGEPTVLIKCHAGCSTTEEILPALGMEASDLFGNGHQTELFPGHKFSPVGLEVLLRLPHGAERSFIVTSALGRYAHISGGRERVRSMRAIKAVIVESGHRQAAIRELGISRSQLNNDVARWKEWGVAHGCSRSVLTIFVRMEMVCPVCGRSLADDQETTKRSLADDQDPLGKSLADDQFVPATTLTESGFDKGVGVPGWEPWPEMKALEMLREDETRRRR